MFIYESSAISKALAPAPGERGGGVPPGVSREPHRGPGRTREGEGWGRGSGTSPPPFPLLSFQGDPAGDDGTTEKAGNVVGVESREYPAHS